MVYFPDTIYDHKFGVPEAIPTILTEEELKESGRLYLECPECNHLFSEVEMECLVSDLVSRITCHCKYCNETYQGTHDWVEIFVNKGTKKGLFEPKEYTIPWKKYGKPIEGMDRSYVLYG